ncbi:MAG: hypothetical protein NTV86_23465 [Planctomycetota bacterium]|nr:hypothetical protein [Planctomycetota bacterium]
MTGVKETVSATRVVLCSREPSLAALVSDQLGSSARCRPVASPYEAAAEALAGEADLVIVDFAALRGPHAALPGVLRRHGLAVLALVRPGEAIPTDLPEGVRVVAPEDIASALADLLAGEPAAPPPEPRPAPALESPRGLVSPEELAALLEDQP